MKKRLFLLIILGVSHFILFAQSAKQWNKQGNKLYEMGDYLGALKAYKKAYSMEKNVSEYVFNYAEALRGYNDYKEAEEHYKIALDLDEGQSYPLCMFWLATMQKQQGNYKQAQESFKLFYKHYKQAPSFYQRKAKNEMKACDAAQKIVLDTQKVNIQNVGQLTNSYNSEFAPTLLDEQTLIYSSLRAANMNEKGEVEDKNYHVQLYVAKKEKETWKEQGEYAELISNKAYDNANFTVSPDKKRAYFSRCDEKLGCKIYITEKSRTGWTIPKILEAPVNMEGYNSSQPFITIADDKETLFFISDKPGGKGKYDIYYSTVSNKGQKYSNPRNAGRRINTPDNDLTPFYVDSTECFYFSSNWHLGIGGYDIFKSCGRLRSLPLPENMGVPYNSPANDLYFSIYDTIGYLTSNREGSFSLQGETCCNDIYEFKLNKPKPVTPKDSVEDIYKSLELLNKYLPVTLYFHNDEPNPKTTDTLTNKNYLSTYEKYYDMQEKYMEEYSKDLASEEEELNAKEEIEDFFTGYVDKGVNDLKMFTKLLLRELNEGGQYNITIKGYASPLAKSDYNEKLTLRRISSLINYLNEYNVGEFKPYINKTSNNGGYITFTKIPFGEYKADTTVSDNLNDQRNSIYSKKAALERKIEILSIDLAKQKSISTTPSISKMQVDSIVDLGKLSYGKKYDKKFKVKNIDNKPVSITTAQSDCSCTVIENQNITLLPGEEKEIPFTFYAIEKGKIMREIRLTYGETKQVKKIRVKALVYGN